MNIFELYSVPAALFLGVHHSPELPPLAVVGVRSDLALEHVPPPQVHKVAEGQERDLLQAHVEQVVDFGLGVVLGVGGEEVYLTKMIGSRHGQGNGVPDSLMET